MIKTGPVLRRGAISLRPGLPNHGGIIGTLLDCHSNWTSAWHLMVRNGLDRLPCTVTGEFAVKLLKPTPIDEPVELSAMVVESTKSKAAVETTLSDKGEMAASCRGTRHIISVEKKDGNNSP